MDIVEELAVIAVVHEGAFDSVLRLDCGAICDKDGDGVSLMCLRFEGGDVDFLFERDLDWGGRRFFGIAFPFEPLLRVLVAAFPVTFVHAELAIVLDVLAITRRK